MSHPPPSTTLSNPWWALVVLLAGTLLPPLDFFVVNTALPFIQQDLHASDTATQLVVSAYAATYAVFLITGGRLGDLYGRRRVFLAAMAGFSLSSLICGLASSAAMLVFGRILQGAAAAVMAPQALASIHALFPDTHKQRALGLYGVTFGMAAVVGQVMGGWLIDIDLFGLGWRNLFLVNIPVLLVAIPAALMLVPENRAEHPQRLDPIGILLLAAALICLIVPLVEGRHLDWPLWSLVMLLASLPLFLLFWHHEHRLFAQGRDPLVIPAVFDAPGMVRGLLATVFFYAIAPFFLLFAIHQHAYAQLPPLQAGLSVLPLGVGFLIGPLFSGWCISATYQRYVAPVAIVIEALGVWGTGLVAASDHAFWLSITLFLIGAGEGMALPPLVRHVVQRVDRRWAGLAAGLVNSVLQCSSALFVAIEGGLFFSLVGHAFCPARVAQAFTITCIVIGALLLLSALLAYPRRADTLTE
ncbi:MFS transporter [Zymobacter sp. IVIA_5232.4 C2]|uniref:MFS transporter n=1 Tax=Zymobacter sp. IVIA_5232.4 C2 TaxID=3394855 RepID=UPI0039C16782